MKPVTLCLAHSIYYDEQINKYNWVNAWINKERKNESFSVKVSLHGNET